MEAQWQMRLAKAGKDGRIKVRIVADPEYVIFPPCLMACCISPTNIWPLQRADEALVLHASSPHQERWQQLKETNLILHKVSKLHGVYQESENLVVSSLCLVASTVTLWFNKNETARVLRAMKLLNPSFSMEAFKSERWEYIVPKVMDAYLSADDEVLKAWCSEAVCLLIFLLRYLHNSSAQLPPLDI